MTDAPEAPRQEREALARLIDPPAFNGPDIFGNWTSRRNAALKYADRILAAGYVTPEAHAAATGYAHRLAVSMAGKHYPEAPQWEPLPDLIGLLTQIDNMTTGLVRAEAHAAELREAWEAGRDAAAEGVASAAAKWWPDWIRAKMLIDEIRDLTPPAPKGDDR